MNSDETNYDDEAKDRSNYEEDHSVDDNDEYDELCSSSSISSQSSKSEIVNNFDYSRRHGESIEFECPRVREYAPGGVVSNSDEHGEWGSDQWILQVDDNGNEYYYNNTTGKSIWACEYDNTEIACTDQTQYQQQHTVYTNAVLAGGNW